MYLKSLEIQGFKSFPDKTLISFEKNVTAIVGPNGSGKSNIADAIRWVLGEQSTKTLRGAKMEDVVFSGTDKRGPVGFAQVSLTIDNSDHRIATDYAEVTVTRRYYRSGESEFYINRQPVRLKDIHELFMDTGLGRDGYSIIGQGRIDEILAVRSTDRREFFEEAAGISKFRYRKEEAERKLAATEDNLVRVRDIILELETQVGPLKEQSEKAKKYLALRDELRVIEVSYWLDQLDKLQSGLLKARQDWENAGRQLEAAKAELDALYRQSEELALSMHDKEREIERARDELSLMEGRAAAVEGEISALTVRLSAGGEAISRLRQEMEGASAREGTLDAQMEEKKARMAELSAREQAVEEETAALIEKSRTLATDSGGLAERIDGLLAEESLRLGRAADKQAEGSALLSAIAEIEGRLSAVSGDRTTQEERLSSEEQKAADLARELRENEDKRDGFLNMRRGFELKAAARAKKAQEAEALAREIQNKRRAAEERRNLLSEMEKEYEGFSRAVKSVMAQASAGSLKRVRGTVAQLIRVPDRYTVAVETALGAGLSNIVVESEGAAKAAVSYLKSSGAGRATFLPMDVIRGSLLSEKAAPGEPGAVGIASELCETAPEYQEILRNLLGRVLVANDLDAAIRIAGKYGHRFRIVTLDGQILNAGGSMTGGSVAKNVGILSRANELARLKESLRRLVEEQKEAEKTAEEARRSADELAYELDVLAGELRQAEDAVLRLSAEKNQHELLLESLRSSLAGLEEEKRLAAERTRALQAQADEALRLEQQLRADAAEARTRAEELSAGRSELAERQNTLQAELSEKREEKSRCVAEREAIGRSLSELVALRQEMGGERMEKGRLIEEYRRKNEEIAALIEGQKETLGQERADAERKKEEIRTLAQDKMKLEALRTQREKESQGKNEELLELERERLRLESKKAQAEQEERTITDKLWEEYELTRVTGAAVRTQLESQQRAAKRISELKSGIRGLGSVNVDAIEEYKKVAERYEFLSAQREDLEKGKEGLLDIIDDVEGHMKEVFSKQFAVINRNFDETFREIFGGGSAALELTDPSDVLECGIEIKVRLPGKSLKTISLLSGGEKAFVAIALYFAILKVRPTPFCVLDEIEAALDDVNVDRFARYLHKLCDKTQFIVITHRRGTMEQSEVLYGVTMQEKGISRLLALHVSDVEREIGVKPQ